MAQINDETIILPKRPGSHAVESTPEPALRCFMHNLANSGHFVDIGCGTGAVIQWRLDHGFKGKITGIELEPEIADYARRRFENSGDVEIICGDALGCVPPDADTLYAFSPFDYATMRRFLDVLKVRFPHGNVAFLYYGKEGAAFVERGDWDVVRRTALYISPIEGSKDGSLWYRALYAARPRWGLRSYRLAPTPKTGPG